MADVAVNTLPTESSPAAADTVLTVKDVDGSLVRVALSAIKSLFGVPSASSSTPADLGTAAAGSSGDFARADHVHNKPTYSKSDVGLGNVANVLQYSASNPPPAQVFWAEYGVTTSSDIEDAYNAGKAVLLDYNGDIFTLSQIDDSTHDAFFTCVLDDTVYTISVATDNWDASSYVTIPTTASDVGAVAVAQGVSHAGEFCVVGSDGNITTVTMTAWAGGSY